VITPAQIRMAHAALAISVRELAKAAQVADSLIHRFETNKGGMYAATLGQLQDTLEAKGVIFLNADASVGPGVRMTLQVTNSKND